MKLYIHTSSTTELVAMPERTDVVFRISASNCTPLPDCNVYTVYVDNKRDLNEITQALYLLLGDETNIAYCSHLIPNIAKDDNFDQIAIESNDAMSWVSQS